jgi:hypothetical protein
MVSVPREPDEEVIADCIGEASVGILWDEDTDYAFKRDYAMAFYRAMIAAGEAE